MHTFRTLRWPAWSIRSCLLTIRLGNASCPHLQVVVVVGAPTKEVRIAQAGHSQAVYWQPTLGTVSALTCRWWWWVHTLRSLHWPAWSITSCLLTIRLENSSYPHLQVVVVVCEPWCSIVYLHHNCWNWRPPSAGGGGALCTLERTASRVGLVTCKPFTDNPFVVLRNALVGLGFVVKLPSA